MVEFEVDIGVEAARGQGEGIPLEIDVAHGAPHDVAWPT